MSGTSMSTPLSPSPSTQITFLHADHSMVLEARIRELVGRLTRFHDRIMSCQVVVEGPSPHHQRQGTFRISFEIVVPGGFVHATNGHAPKPEHSDPYIALRDAFDNAKRQLVSQDAIH